VALGIVVALALADVVAVAISVVAVGVVVVVAGFVWWWFKGGGIVGIANSSTYSSCSKKFGDLKYSGTGSSMRDIILYMDFFHDCSVSLPPCIARKNSRSVCSTTKRKFWGTCGRVVKSKANVNKKLAKRSKKQMSFGTKVLVCVCVCVCVDLYVCMCSSMIRVLLTHTH